MPTQEPQLVVIGSGPGIGCSTAQRFAAGGFGKICLLSRNSARLQEDEDRIVESMKNKSVIVTKHVVDISDLSALRKTLAEVEQKATVECVFFNAARIRPSRLLETPTEEMEEDFRTTNLALYETAKWAIPILQANKDDCRTAEGPSLLVTNSLLWQTPLPYVASLSMSKAAQRALVLSLHHDFGKDVHVGLLYVGGQVSPDNPRMSPTLIADGIWEFHRQPKDRWTREIEILEEGQTSGISS